VAIIGAKIARIERQVDELIDLAEPREGRHEPAEPVGMVEERSP
jgi:hypothetical protein